MRRNPDERAPEALQNEDVTGITPKRQDEIVHQSGEAQRRDAAGEFIDEQQDQAKAAGSSGQRGRAEKGAQPADRAKGHTGVRQDDEEGEFDHRVSDARRGGPGGSKGSGRERQ